jgi:hypothetical protein
VCARVADEHLGCIESLCRHFIGGRGCKASTGLYVQAAPVRRCAVGCMHLLSTHRDMVADVDSGLAFGLCLMQAFYRGAWVQGQYWPVRAGLSVLCGGALHVGCICTCYKHAHRDMVADEHLGCTSILYLNRDASILSGGVGARPVPACTCRRLLCMRRCAVGCTYYTPVSTHRDMAAD